MRIGNEERGAKRNDKIILEVSNRKICIYYSNCKNCLTQNLRPSKINTVIALQKPVKPATGGEPLGAPLFTLRRYLHAKDFLKLRSSNRKTNEGDKSAD